MASALATSAPKLVFPPGAGAAADAFFVAYRIPSLLRELFAEGLRGVVADPEKRRRLATRQDEVAEADLLRPARLEHPAHLALHIRRPLDLIENAPRRIDTAFERGAPKEGRRDCGG